MKRHCLAVAAGLRALPPAPSRAPVGMAGNPPVSILPHLRTFSLAISLSIPPVVRGGRCPR